MATLPSIDETIRVILDAAKTYNPRAGEIVPLGRNQMKAGPKYPADDLNAALAEMETRGWIEFTNGNFIKLTDLGFAEM